MFGYVRAVEGDFSEEVKSRYQAAYCGMCHALGRRCGFLTRFTLNYDFTLLAMLFAPPEPVWCEQRCFAHPFRKRRCCGVCAGFDLAADESVILFWQKLADDRTDKGFFAGLPARLAAFGLRGAYQKAARACPEFDGRVREQLSRLRALELENCPSMDRTADAFACILRAAVPQGLEEHRGRILGELLYHLGRWIYLADARDDLEEDRLSGRYNPAAARYGPDGDDRALGLTMDNSLALMGAALQLGEFGCRRPLLENIVYLGLPLVQRAVFDGSWNEIKKQKIWRNDT